VITQEIFHKIHTIITGNLSQKEVLLPSINKLKTFASSVVMCQKETFVTQTLEASCCVVTDLITASTVVTALVNIYVKAKV